MTIVLTIAGLIAATGGCLFLALSQRRHWQAVTRTALRPPRSIWLAGWGLIAVSLVLVILRDGISFGLLFWPMLLGIGALATVGILAWKPSLLGPLANCLINRM